MITPESPETRHTWMVLFTAAEAQVSRLEARCLAETDEAATLQLQARQMQQQATHTTEKLRRARSTRDQVAVDFARFMKEKE